MPDERIWRCSCGQGHFLTIHKWTDNSDPVFLLEGQVRGSLAYRIRQAVRLVLQRGHNDAWLELCLDEKMVREVRDHLNGLLPKQAQIIYHSGVNTTATGVVTTYRRAP